MPQGTVEIVDGVKHRRRTRTNVKRAHSVSSERQVARAREFLEDAPGPAIPLQEMHEGICLWPEREIVNLVVALPHDVRDCLHEVAARRVIEQVKQKILKIGCEQFEDTVKDAVLIEPSRNAGPFSLS
jgi:hypothetical protein